MTNFTPAIRYSSALRHRPILRLIHRSLIAAMLVLLSLNSIAETIIIGVGQQGTTAQLKPERGQTQQQVQQQFGTAPRITAATGTPPIETWHYDDFSVYFEGNYVIHSVMKHRPKAPPADVTPTTTRD